MPPMPMLRSSKVSSILLLVLAACNVAESEEGTLDLSTRPLFYSATETFASGSRVVQGSRMCVEIQGALLEDRWWAGEFDGCYGITLDGQAVDYGSCVGLDELGEALFEYTPLATCPFEDVAPLLVPDRYRLAVIASEDVQRGRLEWWQEATAERLLDPGPRGSFPADWIPAADEALQLVPDVEVSFPVVLLDATGEHVAWDIGEGEVVETRNGELRSLAAIPDYPGYFSVGIGEGERSELAFVGFGVERPVAEVVATPATAAASLEIVVGYGQGVEPEPERWTEPYGARAIVRDGEGRVIFGAPVEWTLVEGHLVTGPLDPELGTPPEYLGISDACEPPPAAPQARRATLRAELGALVDEVELEWTALPDEEPSDEPFMPDPACQRGGEADGLDDGGCGCTTRPAGGSGWLAWGLVLLGAVRRRGALGRRPSSARGGRVLPSRPQ